MPESAPVPAALPRGLDREGDRVTLSYSVPFHLLVWFAAALPIVIGIAMAILVPQDEPDAPIVPIVAAMFAVGALPVALWWFMVRGVQYVVDADGIEKTRWRRVTVRWDEVTEIRPWGRQIVVRAAGGVDAGGRRPGAELRLPAGYLAVRPPELLRFLRQCWAARRDAQPGPAGRPVSRDAGSEKTPDLGTRAGAADPNPPREG